MAAFFSACHTLTSVCGLLSVLINIPLIGNYDPLIELPALGTKYSCSPGGI